MSIANKMCKNDLISRLIREKKPGDIKMVSISSDMGPRRWNQDDRRKPKTERLFINPVHRWVSQSDLHVNSGLT